MANREVFNANSSGDLIVDDSIEHTGRDAHQDNRDPLHLASANTWTIYYTALNEANDA